ncbi:hypothetical protein CLPU_10c01520 [Gottschalkia purinilytica]|uniref:Uncharacterized protein n=1 Tax=Gottschalkia purinilytica TaxID=1503 RepID=A0A0L0W9H9_GOTPU|nr:hypothetical protein [Gottschalkia purinilytica]KNF08097.1 hypothetical protein CLPU_10c01520 [Gottschalkia purinilytica]
MKTITGKELMVYYCGKVKDLPVFGKEKSSLAATKELEKNI